MKTKTVYAYNKDTKFFDGVIEYPEEEYLKNNCTLPEGYTEQIPPENKDNYIIKFINNKWEYIPLNNINQNLTSEKLENYDETITKLKIIENFMINKF